MKRIIISRTDSIGDVVLTLPMAGVIKKHLPDSEILFLGRGYTQPVIEASRFVDEFINWDTIQEQSYLEQKESFRSLNADAIIHVFMVSAIANLADLADIPVKIGTTHRLFTWLFCNQLVWFSRKQSDLHEAQLNLKLLKPLGINMTLEREEISQYYGMMPDTGYRIPDAGYRMTDARFKLILHPKSKGSAREWGLENFSRLIDLLPAEIYEILITGTEAERELMTGFLSRHKDQITDMTGKLTLTELMDFIRACDGLVAASTGPLHLAAAFGKVAIGLYAPMRPIYPTRWAPLGPKASYLVLAKECNDCRETLDCHCMKEISAEKVVGRLEGMRQEIV